MKISREQTLKVLKYLEKNKDFYFPFKIICKDFSENDYYYDFDCIDIEYEELKSNSLLLNFALEENLQNLDNDTTTLMAKGFLDKIENTDILDLILEKAVNYKKEWKKELCESEDIEEYGLNEFIGGKAEAYEECKKILEKHLLSKLN